MSAFLKNNQMPVDQMAAGIQRQILGYQENLMLVKVFFAEGSVAERHRHPHQQIGHVLEGRFELEIDGKHEVLVAGDSFVVAANLPHTAICLKKGVILDSFSPAREDFLNK
jgi:quercetin dioxygenase-like cupin family protein